MASPTVRGGVSQLFSASSFAVTLPSGLAIGDLCFLIFRTGATATVSSITGGATWTQLLLDNTDATDDNTYVYYGVLTALTNPTIVLSTSVKGVVITYGLRGAAAPATQAPQVSTRQIFTTAANAANPPAISPTGGSKDYTFIAVVGLGGTATASDVPSGYSPAYFFGNTTSGNPAAGNCGLYASIRTATVATEDPGGFLHTAANLGGVSFVIAVHPAGPPPAYGVVALPITFGKDVKGSIFGTPALETTIDKFNRVDGPLSAGAGSLIWTGHRLFDPNPTDLGIRSGILEVLSGDGYATQEGSITILKSTNDFIFDYVSDSGTDNNPIEVYMALSNEGPTWNGSRFIYDAGSDSWIGADTLNGASTNLGSFPANGRPLAGESYWFKTVNRSVSLFKRASASDPWSKLGVWNCSVRPANSGRFGFLFRGAGQRLDNLRGGPIQVVQYGQVALPITFDKDVKGRRKALGSVALPITFKKDVHADLIYPGIKTQIDSMDSLAGWSVFYRDYYPGLQQSADRVEGTGSFLFGGGDLSDGVGGFQTTLSPQDLTRARWISFYVKTWLDAGYASPNGRPLSVRLGTSSTVYWEGTLPANTVKDNDTWTHLALELNTFVAVGGITSWDSITYIAFSWATPGGALAYYDDVCFISPSLKFTSKVDSPIIFGKEVRGRLGKNYKDEVLADSPFIYWRMDEVGAPQDISGNGLHITTDSGSTQVPGLIPWDPLSMAKGFNGTMMNRGAPTFYQNTMSFEVWLQRSRTDVYEILVDQYNSGWTIAVNSNGVIYVRRSYGPDLAVSSRIKILDTLPHHLVVTADFKTREVIFYLDDQVPESVIGNPWDHSNPQNYPLFVGSQWNAYAFSGTMDEMAFYSYVLSPNQIAYHRTQGLREAPKTYFGATAFPISFNKEVSGARKTFAKTNAPLVFSKDVKGVRKTFSKVDSPITFGEVTSGIRVPFRYYGQVALPITFSKDVTGQRKAFGRTALPITFVKDVNGRRTTFGKLDLQIVGAQYVRGIIHAYSQSSMQTLFGKETAGKRKTFGQVAVPLIFSKDVQGKRKTFGRVALPIVFDGNTVAQRQTFGQVAAPFIFDSAVQGTRTALGKLYLPMNLLLVVGEGHLGVHGEVSLPVVMTMGTSGKVIHVGVILNNAKMIYLGTVPVQAVYVDDQKVWPMT